MISHCQYQEKIIMIGERQLEIKVIYKKDTMHLCQEKRQKKY